MFRKLVIATAASATIGAAALIPTVASAGGGGMPHPHHHHHWRGFYGGPIIVTAVDADCWVHRWVKTPFGPKLKKFYVCD